MDFSDMRWIKRVIISEISLSYLILSENRYLQGIKGFDKSEILEATSIYQKFDG